MSAPPEENKASRAPETSVFRQLKKEQVAEILSLDTPRTLDEWRRLRRGPPWRRLGKKLVRYDEGELRSWLQSQSSTLSENPAGTE